MRGVVPPVPARRSGGFSPEVKRSSGVERARKASPEVPRTTENSAGPDVSQGHYPPPRVPTTQHCFRLWFVADVRQVDGRCRLMRRQPGK